MERYKVIKNIDKIHWDINCPIQVDRYNILFDNTLQKNVLQFKLKNISDKSLQSVYMDIVCYDAAKDILGSIKDISYTGLSVKTGESFGEKQPIATEYKDIGYIDIVITKAVFSDESVWRNDNNLSLKPSDSNSDVKAYYYELYAQYARECDSILADKNYVYEDKGDYWICSCGQPNRKENQNCIFCHIAKEKLEKISNKEYLDKKLDEYSKLQKEINLKKEKEEKDKAEKDKQTEAEKIVKNKKIKKLSLIALVSVMIVVALGFGINYCLKARKYSNADMLLQNSDYAKAISEFTELNGFRDSDEKLQEILFNAQKNSVEFQNKISVGSVHTVGVRSDGTVVNVGENSYGECNVSDWKDITAVTVSQDTTVGLKSDGTVVAVGENSYGQCDVSDWEDIVAVSAGDFHTVGLKSNGTVVAVGYNEVGQCNVYDWKDIVAVSANCDNTVGLKSDGTVVAVGWNNDGQCDVSDWKDIVAVSAGEVYTVGLKSDGTVVTAGDAPCDVSDWKDIVAVSAGLGHIVGLKLDGTVVAAGYNEDGQCNVSDWRDIVAVSARIFHTVGLKSDGTVVAVGNNEHGQCNVSDWADIGVKNNAVKQEN